MNKWVSGVVAARHLFAINKKYSQKKSMSRADQRKHHYIYRITRTDGSGKYYIGMHSTDDLEDGYFGSGSLLSKSIKKHGKDKHFKEILEHLPTREALKLREREIVNDRLLIDPKCMNLKIGGEGGWDNLNDGSQLHKNRCSLASKIAWIKHPSMKPPKTTKESAAKSAATKIAKYGDKYFAQIASYKKSDEHRAKLAAASKGNKNCLGKAKPKITCPHCSKQGAAHVIFRWHFDNCKNNGLQALK
jgi:hypothetical protein